MTVGERLLELREQALAEGVDLSGIENWSPFGYMMAVGKRLGLSREQILRPVTQR